MALEMFRARDAMGCTCPEFNDFDGQPASARRSGARWDETDLKRRSCGPSRRERMKPVKEHRVPLAPRALAIIQEMGDFRSNPVRLSRHQQGRPLSNEWAGKLVR